MLFRNTATFHMLAVASCLPRFNASARVNAADFVLEVQARNRYFSLQPQFMSAEQGEYRYSPHNHPLVTGFIGWRPYFNKRWPAGSGKFAFKDFCAAHNLPTPRFDRASPRGMRSFLIKTDKSSFANGMRGPFGGNSQQAADEGLENPYYEEFVDGLMLKASYWDAKLVCLEVQSCPTVAGDGTNTIRQLIQAKLKPYPRKGEWQFYQDMVAFEGRKLDDVLEKGRIVRVDCRFQSNFVRDYDGNANMLKKAEHAAIVKQLGDWGPIFLESIPPELRDVGTVYTVDAMADADGRVWLLEMNCNPGMHPEVYFSMFEALFGPANEAVQVNAAEGAPVMPPMLPPPAFSPSAFPPSALPAARDYREPLARHETLGVARFHAENGRLEDALRNLKPLISEPDVCVEALPLAGRVYAQLRLTESAQDCYRKYLALHPDASLESFELGITYFERGDNQRAEELWGQILKREPAHPPALFYSGLLAAGEGRVDVARGHLEALFQACPPENLYVHRGRELLTELARDSSLPRH